jgi:ComF family protein
MGCGSSSDQGRGICRECRARVASRLQYFEPPEFVRSAWALGSYDGPLGALIRRGKYARDGQVLQALGRHLAQAGRGRLPPVDRVTHVPVPWLRKVHRGFDQAEILAAPVAKALGLPHDSLLRRRHRTDQVGRSRRERRYRAREAFLAAELTGDRVLLVDDICTTGSTASGCAAALLSSGASRVDLLCVARTASDLE